MSVNKHQPHVHVLPEDDANRQLANAFTLDLDQSNIRKIKVLPVAGGWTNVLNQFKSDHVSEMNRYPARFMVLLIDFDERQDRLETAKAAIPEHLTERVFILGARSEPEALKPVLGPYETIGRAMAKDCREDTNTTWGHDLLRHNAGELDRLREHVRPILFQST
jgi:hypothetical protein